MGRTRRIILEDDHAEVVIPQQVHWFAVYTRPRHEKKVAAMLERKGFEYFLPLYTVRRRWSDRWKTISFPLFPNYLFVRFDLMDHRRYISLLRTPGLVHLVRFRGRVEPVPDEEVEAVRRLCTSGVEYAPFPYLENGRWVEVVRGPLRGMRGYILRREGHYKLVISVHILMRSVATHVSVFDVEPLW